MLPKSPKWLEDIRVSSLFILDVAKGKTLRDYSSDVMVRSAVERHFEIIGEAMNRIARYDPETAERVGDYAKIIAFRNVLIHGYDLVNHEDVWNVIKNHLPDLLTKVEALLNEVKNDL